MNLKTYLLSQGFQQEEVITYLELALEHDDEFSCFETIDQIMVDQKDILEYDGDFREFLEARQ